MSGLISAEKMQSSQVDLLAKSGDVLDGVAVVCEVASLGCGGGGVGGILPQEILNNGNS